MGAGKVLDIICSMLVCTHSALLVRLLMFSQHCSDSIFDMSMLVNHCMRQYFYEVFFDIVPQAVPNQFWPNSFLMSMLVVRWAGGALDAPRKLDKSTRKPKCSVKSGRMVMVWKWGCASHYVTNYCTCMYQHIDAHNTIPLAPAENKRFPCTCCIPAKTKGRWGSNSEFSFVFGFHRKKHAQEFRLLRCFGPTPRKKILQQKSLEGHCLSNHGRISAWRESFIPSWVSLSFRTPKNWKGIHAYISKNSVIWIDWKHIHKTNRTKRNLLVTMAPPSSKLPWCADQSAETWLESS